MEARWYLVKDMASHHDDYKKVSITDLINLNNSILDFRISKRKAEQQRFARFLKYMNQLFDPVDDLIIPLDETPFLKSVLSSIELKVYILTRRWLPREFRVIFDAVSRDFLGVLVYDGEFFLAWNLGSHLEVKKLYPCQ